MKLKYANKTEELSQQYNPDGDKFAVNFRSMTELTAGLIVFFHFFLCQIDDTCISLGIRHDLRMINRMIEKSKKR